LNGQVAEKNAQRRSISGTFAAERFCETYRGSPAGCRAAVRVRGYRDPQVIHDLPKIGVSSGNTLSLTRWRKSVYNQKQGGVNLRQAGVAEWQTQRAQKTLAARPFLL
jgi:hypothetical protein